MEIRHYVTPDGKDVFRAWWSKLRDPRAREMILMQLDRLELGNTGHCKSLGQGLYELRIHYGPGYRVYYGQTGKEAVLLLCGGNKTSQKQDIKRARKYWRDHRRHTWKAADHTQSS